MLMQEIITRQEPHHDVDPIDVAIHVTVKDKGRNCKDVYPQKYKNLMKSCWYTDKEVRHNADKIAQILTEFT